MELRQLKYFMVAAEEENLHRAAERLCVSQSALSRRIHDLEVELRVELFERRQQRIRLSQAGLAFLQDVRRTLDELERATRRCRSVAAGEEGELTLGFYESAVRHPLIAGAVREFRASYPQVELRLESLVPSRALEAVLRREVDAAFVYDRPGQDERFRWMPIATGNMALALPCDHPLARKPEISAADLQAEYFIWLRRDIAPFLHDKLVAACTQAGLTPRIIQNTVNESTRLHLVSAGMGVTFIVSDLGGYWPDSITVRRLKDFSIPIQLDLVWLSDSPAPPVRCFSDSLERLRKP